MIVRVANDGHISAHPTNKKGEEKSYTKIPFQFLIRQTLPNGKTQDLKIDPSTLKSENKVTGKLRELSITGETKKGAGFQLSLTFKRDILSLGGKITGKGQEKHPLSFHYRARMNHFHGQLLRRLKGNQAAFDKIIEKDWFKLYHLDKESEKRILTDVFEEGDEKTLNGPGSKKIEVEAAIVDKNKRILLFEAKGSSKLEIIKPKSGPFHEGYHIEWSSDQEQKSRDEALITFKIEEL